MAQTLARPADAPVREALAHPPLTTDIPTIRPTLGRAVSGRARAALLTGAIAAGAVTAAATTTPGTALVAAVTGAGALTAVAANWSTCGLSVAGVVAAPKQPGRAGASTPWRRLGWHALGSLTTALPTGALLGLLGIPLSHAVPVAALLGVWAALALAYGLHELGLLRMPTPMRRRQLPRHMRKTTQPWKVSFVFGTLIGPGFLIFIRSSAYYLLALGVLAAGSPVLGAALFALVALGRCLPSLFAILHGRRGGSMPGFLSAMCVLDRRIQSVTGAGLAALAAFAGAALL